MATIKEVAQLAGVSVATVSRVINMPETVSEKKLKAVECAIQQLNYTPNALGRNLRQQHTKRILVVLNNISNQFYSGVLKGIEERAKQDNYSTLICTTRGNRDLILSHIEMLSSKVADGVIFLSPELASDEILKVSANYPIVCTCEPVKSEEITCVTIDNVKAGYDATQFLLNKGHRDIVLAGGDNDISYSSELREIGFKKAMRENKIEITEDNIINDGYGFNSGVRTARKILKRNKLPQAVFAISDASAIGIIKTLHENGVRVPEDISVMGFDNTSISEMYVPSVATVSQPRYEMGSMAMDLLINMIDGNATKKMNVVEHKIIERQSVINK